MQVGRLGEGKGAVYAITMDEKEATMLLTMLGNIGGTGPYRRLIVDKLYEQLVHMGLDLESPDPFEHSGVHRYPFLVDPA